jgi:hypothetical protein
MDRYKRFEIAPIIPYGYEVIPFVPVRKKDVVNVLKL